MSHNQTPQKKIVSKYSILSHHYPHPSWFLRDFIGEFPLAKKWATRAEEATKVNYGKRQTSYSSFF